MAMGRWDHMTARTRLLRRTAGRVLLFCAAFGSTVVSLPAAAGADDAIHVIVEGDTLSHLAVEYDTTVAELRERNGLSSDRVYVGQEIVVSLASSTYEVQPGDTLSEIAERFGTTSAELAELNGLENRNRLRVGTQLALPAGAVAAVVAPVVDLGRYPSLPQRLLDRPERLALIPVFEHWAAANELPVDLLMAVAFHESGWNNEAVSYKGAIGIGQIMPVSGTWIAASLIGEPTLDPRNPEHNIRMSARYLDWLLDRFGGDETLALGGYFQGPTSVSSGEWMDATQRYVENVQAQRALFG